MHLEKQRFRHWLERRFFLRLHMFFILAATFISGAIATKVLLELGFRRMWLRYLLAVFLAYLLFLVLIKLWLLYLRIRSRREAHFEPAELLDLAATSTGGDTAQGFEAGGGAFGGGGATGDFGPAQAADSVRENAGASAASFGFSLDEGVVVLVILAGLVLGVFAAGGYVLWAAPAVLSEVAFEALLAAALVRRARRIDRADWVGSVVRATAIPFAVALIFSVAVGAIAQRECPGAVKLTDVFACYRQPTTNNQQLTTNNY